MIVIEYLAMLAATCALLWLASAAVCLACVVSAALQFGFDAIPTAIFGWVGGLWRRGFAG
jgi:hypothetical protein